MSLRVVVYAEGTGELARDWLPGAAPGVPIEDEDLGPAHVLARRGLRRTRGVAEMAVVFEHGLRKTNTRAPRGSDLHRETILRRLLDWSDPAMRPQLALVFVDEDDEKGRYPRLKESIEGLRISRPPTVIVVARREFEAWLVTDRKCLERALGRTLEDPGDPETWGPARAKALLANLLEGETSIRRSALRREISTSCDLEVLRGSSRSFRRFLEDLETVPLP